jgi:dolichol kinase
LIYRKLFHLLTLFLIIPVLILDKEGRIIFSILFLLTVFLIDTLRLESKSFRKIFMILFGGMLKKHEYREYTGSTYLAISYVLINLLFEKEIIIFSMLILTICDPIAAIIGTYTKPNIKIFKKSLNGLIGFYLAGIIISLIFFPNLSLTAKILAVLISGIVEIFTPIDDNLAIPITSSIILKLS